MLIKEVGPGHLPQGSMKGTAGAEHTRPVPLGARLTNQELAGSPPVHDVPPVSGAERQRDPEAIAWRQPLEQGSSPLNLAVSSLSGLEHKPTDGDASSLPTNQRDGSALHTEGVKDGTGQDSVAQQLSHAGHSAEPSLLNAPSFRPAPAFDPLA